MLTCETLRQSVPKHTIVSILQAYSAIALLGTQESFVASEDDRRSMQIIFELLNGLVQNYYDVVSDMCTLCSYICMIKCIQSVLHILFYPHKTLTILLLSNLIDISWSL